ncbi:PEP-utilizing enzyme [Micromonospora sp. WMMD882]|uniref:PEP/pyruvate-binding domain-containing protein n=1 Tax=Micromonospora sp. WMMD882 TaxID=3015151 RepID=UPI00248CFC20|nr:PEP/pyruvate-binding domain-containing protein [Micromonospora sp. WMMD882]WBB80676.1 PEP-utilizing enzyme [Micromonospora sp. WMMD882]
MPLVRAGDPRLTDPTLVGHKFARQEQLRLAGFPVPGFCCVPVTVFDTVAAAPMASAPAADAAPEHLLDWAKRTADDLRAATLTPEVAAALEQAVTEIAAGEHLLAVRACVVADATDTDGTGEDSATDAFAGLTDSFLYVPPAEVARRVVDCWASGLNAESILYRARRGLPPSSARVAVGVQRMVPGVRSFVAFSRDPRTGADCCVVAAAHGIGEGVVQERADVDHFFVDNATDTVRVETVVKKSMMVPAADGTGPVVRPVPTELADAPVLTDDEARRVAALAARVQEHFGLPQDIEGTFTPDGTIHLVQARPVVFAGGPPRQETARPRSAYDDVPWSNHNITESYPGISGALTYSQAREFYRLIFRDVYRRMGVPERRLRANDHHLRRMVGLLRGRVYYRLDAWFVLHHQIPGFPLIRPWWEVSMGLTGDYRPSRPELRRALVSVPGLLWRLARLPGSARRFLRWWDELVEQHRDLDERSAEELVATYRRLWAEVGVRWGVTLVNTFFMLGTATFASALVRRWVDGDEQRTLGGLLMGGREHRSVLGVRSGIALAELIRARPELAARIADCPDGAADGLWRELVDGTHGGALAEAAREHLRRYGDRAPHDLKLEEPSPRQRPGMIVTMLRPLVRGDLTVADSRARERQSRAEAERELRRNCPSPARRLVIRTLAAGLRFFVRTREDTRYCRSQLYGLTRHVMWRLGELLTEAGRLDDRLDVLDLTVDEVLGAYDGTLVDTDLRAVVRRRREQRLAAADGPDPGVRPTTPRNRPLPSLLAGPAGPVASAGDGPVELRGLPSSNGVVVGQARVVLDPSTPPETCRDRIIVAKETDPGWLMLMMVARGMVVERGTLLSHTAITGRLLGVPTVVAVPDATTLIEDGAWIEVDGATGTVRGVPAPDPATV